MNLSINYHRVAAVLFISALPHVAVIILSGGQFIMPMIAGSILWAVIGYGLLGQRRWLAYIAFVAALAGAIYALGFGMSQPGAVGMAFMGIAGANLIAVLLLFVILWRKNPAKTA